MTLPPPPPSLPLSLPLALLCSLLTVAGCVGDPMTAQFPAPIGGGIYSAGSVPRGTAGYHEDSYQRSIRFCFDQGKQLLRVDPTGSPVSGRPAGEILFRCVGPGEPGWKEPVG
jgi:hypothetical protein